MPDVSLDFDAWDRELAAETPNPGSAALDFDAWDQELADEPVEEGNIDLFNRPKVRLPDGRTATVRSESFNFGDGVETLLPTISDDGRELTTEEAVKLYRDTGKHLGKFKTPEAATKFAQALHQQQEAYYLGTEKPELDFATWDKELEQEAYQPTDLSDAGRTMSPDARPISDVAATGAGQFAKRLADAGAPINPLTVTGALATDVYEGAARGSAGLGKAAGEAVVFTGNRLPDGTPGKAALTNAGEAVSSYYDEQQKAYAPPKETQKNILDNPETLFDPSYWAQGVGEMAPSLAASILPYGAAKEAVSAYLKGVNYLYIMGKQVPVTPALIERVSQLVGSLAGGGTGGALEGLGTYEELRKKPGWTEPEAAAAAVLQGTATIGTNAISMDALTRKLGGATPLARGVNRTIVGGTEAGSEVAEGGTQPYMEDLAKLIVSGKPIPSNWLSRVGKGLKEEANVAGPAFLTGMAGAGNLNTNVQEQDESGGKSAPVDFNAMNATAFPGASEANRYGTDELVTDLFNTRAGLAWVQTVQDIAQRDPELAAKLQVTSLARGGHAENSLHYLGDALDHNSKNLTEEEYADLDATARKYGLVHDIKGEPWHLSFRGTEQSPAGDQPVRGPVPPAAVHDGTPHKDLAAISPDATTDLLAPEVEAEPAARSDEDVLRENYPGLLSIMNQTGTAATTPGDTAATIDARMGDDPARAGVLASLRQDILVRDEEAKLAEQDRLNRSPFPQTMAQMDAAPRAGSALYVPSQFPSEIGGVNPHVVPPVIETPTAEMATNMGALEQARQAGTLDAARAFPVAQAETLAGRPQLPSGQGFDLAPARVQPEPKKSIDARIAAMLDPKSRKKAVLVTPGSPLPASLPKGATTFLTQHGTVITTDPKLKDSLPFDATDAQIGKHIVGWGKGRPPLAPNEGAVVRALDERGSPVSEIHVAPNDVRAALRIMKEHSPVGKATVLPVGDVLAERQAQVDAEKWGADVRRSLSQEETEDHIVRYVMGRINPRKVTNTQRKALAAKYGYRIFSRPKKLQDGTTFNPGQSLDQLESEEELSKILPSTYGSDNLYDYLINVGKNGQESAQQWKDDIEAGEESMVRDIMENRPKPKQFRPESEEQAGPENDEGPEYGYDPEYGYGPEHKYGDGRDDVPFHRTDKAPTNPAYPDLSDTDPNLDEYLGKIDAWDKEIAAWTETAPDVLQFTNGGGQVRVVSKNTRQTKNESPWRMTYFMKENGNWVPSGHEEYRTKLEAVKDATISGAVYSPGLKFHRTDKMGFYSQMEEVLSRPGMLPKATKTGAEMAAVIERHQKSGKFKDEELADSGIMEWLASIDGPVTRQDVLDEIQVRRIEIEEVVKGGDASKGRARVEEAEEDGIFQVVMEGTDEVVSVFYNEEDAAEEADRINEERGDAKYGQYQLPGGKNYRELVLTLPRGKGRSPYDVFIKAMEAKYGDRLWAEMTEDEIGTAEELEKNKFSVKTAKAPEEYKSPHWDEPNVVAHVRISERTDADGKRVLHVEEIQSDWHQEGRKKGYATPPQKGRVESYRVGTGNTLWKIVWEDGTFSGGYLSQENAEADVDRRAQALNKSVPDAPFKKSWSMLAMKRVIRYAVENGFDRVAWTPGAQQAERYDLSKKLKEVSAKKNENGTYQLAAEDLNGVDVFGYAGKTVTPSEMEDQVGKEVAEKLIKGADAAFGKPWPKNVSHNPEFFRLFPEDLKIGGEGMKGFYDKILPAEVNKYIKNWGAKVGSTFISKEGEHFTVKRFSPEELTVKETKNGLGDDIWIVEDRDGNNVVRNLSFRPGSLPKEELLAKVAEHINTQADKKLAERGQPLHSFDLTPTMKEAVLGGQPLYQKQAQSPTSGAAKEDIEKALDPLLKKFQGIADRVHVVQSYGDLPVGLYAAAKHANMIGGFDAVYWQGNVYIVADAMTAKEAAPRYLKFILGHEGGHHVARMLFPDPAQRKAFFSALAKLAPEQVAGYLDRHGIENTLGNRIMAAEEVAMDLVGESLASMKGALRFRMQQFIARLRKLLARVMPERFGGATNQMIVEFVAEARAAIRRDGRVEYGLTGGVADTFHRAVQAISSAGTSIKQVPALFKRGWLKPGTVNVDIGGGKYDLGTEHLKKQGVENLVYDPFNRSPEHNAEVVGRLSKALADTATVSNVLNVIQEPEVRQEVARQAAKAIKPGGAAYFQIYERDGSGVGEKTSAGWQNNMRAADYVTDVEKHFRTVERRGKTLVARDPIKTPEMDSWQDELGHPAFQRAWHGSPVRGITKFDSAFNKTGEGANAFGWGHYAAGRKELGDWYREQLAREKAKFYKGGELVPQEDIRADLFKSTIDTADEEGFSVGAAREIAQQVYDGFIMGEDIGAFERFVSRSDWPQDEKYVFLTAINTAKQYRVEQSQGQLYELEIPEDHELLDWDKPLSEQPEGVREKLRQIPWLIWPNMEKLERDSLDAFSRYNEAKDRLDEASEWFDPVYDENVRSVEREIDSLVEQGKLTEDEGWKRIESVTSHFKKTGEYKRYEKLAEASNKAYEAHRKAERAWRDGDGLLKMSGEKLYHYAEEKLGSDKAASLYLASIGIPGLRYLDGGSRSKGEGSHNYVVFEDDKVEVLGGVYHRKDGGERLAPNGKPSKLNAKQYEQVRTKEFKDWFGDWEKGEGSKVLDENGEPLVVYHGSKNDFAVFKRGAADRFDKGWFGDGFYLTGSTDLASAYAQRERDGSPTRRPANVMPLFVKLTNPYRVDLSKLSYDESIAFTNPFGGNAGFETWLKENGYDGVVGYRDPEIAGNGAEYWEIVAFSPNQIKSATGNNGEFSRGNDDIRFHRKFDDKDQEARWQEMNKGVGGRGGAIARAKERLTRVYNGFARHFINLPNTEAFARAHEWLRQLESAPEVAKEKALRHLEKITEGLTPTEFDVFQRLVVLDDFVHGVSEGVTEFPGGMTAQDVVKEKTKFSQVAAQEMPRVLAALQARQTIMNEIAAELVQHGILRAEQLKNPAYFRHEVLKYAKGFQGVGTGKEVKKPKPGYAKKRGWSTEEINTNYLEVDGGFMMRAMLDISTAKTIKKFRDSDYNIKPWLVAEARAANEKALRDAGIDPAGLRQHEIRKALGDGFKTWRDLIPESHTSWQEDKGLLYHSGTSVADSAALAALEAVSDPDYLDVAPDALADLVDSMRRALIVSGRKPEMVLPQEIVDTLTGFKPKTEDSLTSALLSKPVGAWKQWVLMNPRRVVKYNLNNMTGDLDAVIAGAPGVLKNMGAAIKELTSVMWKKGTPSARYMEAVERGVFTSGFSIQEIDEIKALDPFKKLLSDKTSGLAPKDLILKWWNVTKKSTQFRENWLRYAAYLHYVDRLEAGESVEDIGYGATYRPLVDGLDDQKDQAAVLARSLVGDYGAISHFGKSLRRTLIPFYSWMEVNGKRYARLFRNAFAQSTARGLKTGGIAGAMAGARMGAYLGIRYAALSLLVSMWNHLAFGDLEDELPPEEQAQLHLILGRGDDGKIYTLRTQGALSDFLGWIGYSDVVALAKDVASGDVSLKDVAKAPVNKVANSFTPLLKTPLELSTGRSLYPDIFRPRPITDKWREMAKTFSLENEYDAALGKPSRGYGASWTGAVAYARDPGEMAYNETRRLIGEWKESKGLTNDGFSTSPATEAAQAYRAALRFGDKRAEKNALTELAKFGKTRDDVDDLLFRSAPLAGVAQKDRPEFMATLDERGKKRVAQAEQWYRDTYLGPRAEAKFDVKQAEAERARIRAAFKTAVEAGDDAAVAAARQEAARFNAKITDAKLPVRRMTGRDYMEILRGQHRRPSRIERQKQRYLEGFEEDNDE